MRRLIIALAITILPSFAMAHGHGGGGHGGMGGGHMGGGHMAGGWGGHSAAAFAPGARMGGWSGRMGGWNGRAGNWNRFGHGHFVRRHGRVFFVGGGPWWWGGYGYDSGCWQWFPTRWGPRRIWVCGTFY